MPKAITSLEGYIRKLANIQQENPGVQLYFRGHSTTEYTITPSVFRNKNHTSSEHLMIRQLISQHPREFAEDHGIFDQLVRAQHYGLPTRLLDATLNPLVALYFSVATKPKTRAKVVIFKPDIGKQKYYDSDVVSCLSALALLTEGEKNELTETFRALNPSKIKNFLLDEDDLAKFNETKAVQKLIQMVRHEKSDFRPIIQPVDLARPVAVIPRKLHNRILAQNGAFILFSLAKTPNKSNMPHIEIDRVDIHEESKERFLKELSYIGISESTLFPEIEKAALAIKSRYQ